MSESTVVYRPEFFFIANLSKFSLKRSMTVGRSGTDLIIDDKKLSSKHCQLNLSGLQVSIIDLGSTNGTFINGEKLPANQERQLILGDRLRIGSYEYVLKDHDEILESSMANSKKESFKFRPKMLLNFFEANVFMRVVYAAIIVFALFFAYFILKVPALLPPELNFVKDLAATYQTRAMILILILLYGVNLFHAYASRIHLKNSLVMKIIFFVMLTFSQFLILLIICFKYDMESNRYVSLRLEISENPGVVFSQDKRFRFEKYYHAIMAELPPEQQSLLTKDYQKMLSMMGKQK